jgi:hypothetical protein
LASEKEPISGRQFSRNVAACTLARAAGQSPPTALRRRQARPFTAELAPARVSPGQGLLSLLGPTIPCRGRTCTCKHVKDRRLHIGIWFLACPFVLGAARVRENRFLVSPSMARHYQCEGRGINGQFWPVSGSLAGRFLRRGMQAVECRAWDGARWPRREGRMAVARQAPAISQDA